MGDAVRVAAAVTTDPATPPLPVGALDALPPDDAAELLRPCCASSRWIGELVEGRPYATLGELTEASDAALARLSWPDVGEALAAHPRIGDRAAGADRESAWSRQEQAATAGLAVTTAEQLRAGNVEYERRFGHVFLICATGLGAEQMLAALRDRLGHEPDAEQAVVRKELAAIVRLRLGKAFS